MLIENLLLLENILKNIDYYDYLLEINKYSSRPSLNLTLGANWRDYKLLFKKCKVSNQIYNRQINITFLKFNPIWIKFQEFYFDNEQCMIYNDDIISRIVINKDKNEISAVDNKLKEQVIKLNQEESYNTLISKIQNYQLMFV